MRILILSDSHGDVASMLRAVERTRPDQIIHLGDCWRDGEELKKQLPLLPVAQVLGNCDTWSFSSPPAQSSGSWSLGAQRTEQLLLTLDGHRVFLCHGHRYQVKSSLLALSYAAREAGAELCLFGHTHVPCLDTTEGLTLLNPGSIGRPFHDFAVAETDGGRLRCALLHL